MLALLTLESLLEGRVCCFSRHCDDADTSMPGEMHVHTRNLTSERRPAQDGSWRLKAVGTASGKHLGVSVSGKIWGYPNGPNSNKMKIVKGSAEERSTKRDPTKGTQ